MDKEERDIFSVIGKLPNYSKLLLELYRCPDISKKHKMLLSAGIAYSVSPFDFIPGIIPVAGQLDNLLIMLRCLKRVLSALDEEVRLKHLEGSGITIEEIDDDIILTGDTLKSIGKGTLRLISNTAKIIGYSTLYGAKRTIRKNPYKKTKNR